MARILLRRIPKKTDRANQQKAMKVWTTVIVEEYSPSKSIPIIAASEYRAKAEKTETNMKGKNDPM